MMGGGPRHVDLWLSSQALSAAWLCVVRYLLNDRSIHLLMLFAEPVLPDGEVPQ